MISDSIHIPIEKIAFDIQKLSKGVWLAVLHMDRIPPHVGIIFSGNYYSLTIRGKESKVDLNVLTKTIQQKKINTVFIKIKDHPVFSTEHIEAIFNEQLNEFEQVKQYQSTCLSPIKKCFNEFYSLQSDENELFYVFMQKLKDNDFVSFLMALNNESTDGLELPFYTQETLNQKIKNERKPYYND